jgi:superfamily II DNA or RNA helicase
MAGIKTSTRRKVSRQHKPDHLSLEEWQRELRRQFGREQRFRIANRGDHPVFSDFDVSNPQSGRTYRVTIRGPRPGDNACTCPDFATNTLGTCKHVEFALARLERRRATAGVLRAGFQPAYSEVYLQYGSRREVRFRPGGECPVELARAAARYFDSDGGLKEGGAATFETFLATAARLAHDLRCGDDVLAFLAELRDADRRAAVLAEAFPRGPRSSAFKNLVNVELYDYQREGALFAARTGRCLLGDEMGLGKTIQAIAAVEIMARHFGVERVLIICPTSLKHQWEREIARLTPRPVGVVNGLRPMRARAFADPSHTFKITNYDTVYADLDLIAAWAPDLVILDEAQRIKNWETRVARNVKQIASPYAIVLTGTPLENRLEELISIVQFVDRYRLGPTFRLLHEHQVRDEAGKVVGYRALDRLGRTLQPILLRRQKEQVLDQLPERIDNHVFVPMTEPQRQMHVENQEIVGRIVKKWRRYRFLTEADQRRLMIALQRMRMVCDSTYLLDPQTEHGHKADEAVTVLGEALERPNTKVVVFSQWLRMHDLLVRRLRARGWGHVLFHGGVSGPKRKDLIDRFRADPDCRVFLSTDAGGVGLNLQHASVVLNLDLPWNPAVLEQRIGRVHRLGQRRPVRVVNFVARGTIEEGMLSVLKFKKSLFAGVLDGGAAEVFLGGSRLTKFMETVETATSSIPADIAAEEAEEPRPTAAGGSPRIIPETHGSDEESDELPATTAAASDAWSGLLQAGMAFVQQMTAAAHNGASGAASAPRGLASPFIGRDERTGETYLRLPVPPPHVLDQALRAVGTLLQGLAGSDASAKRR